MSVAEVAAGTKYSTSITTGWRPPAHIRSMTDDQAAALRKKWYIIAEGQDIPPPIKTFTVSSVVLDKDVNHLFKPIILSFPKCADINLNSYRT